MDATFPYRVIDPRRWRSGIGVWSRHPIVDSGRIDGYQLPMLSTRIRVPGVSSTPRSLRCTRRAVAQPIALGARHRAVSRHLARRGPHAGAGAVIVAGDFNATYDMAPFRRLLDEGYRDAGEQAGRA